MAVGDNARASETKGGALDNFTAGRVMVTVEGKVTTTISQGKVVWENGKLNTVRGAGRFIEMKPFGPLFDGLDKADAAKAAAAEAPVDRSHVGGKSEL